MTPGAGGRVSTGRLPDDGTVRALVVSAHRESLAVHDGELATYIPQLAAADPEACAVSVVSVAGNAFEVGDVGVRFSIQSVSKPFVLALACAVLGTERVRERVGANATGLPFNSVMAVELNDHRVMNPMVNAGAIAATGLMVESAGGREAGWDLVRAGLSDFAGRSLAVDEAVHESESRTNLRNHGIAHLLHSYGSLRGDPDVATDVYTRQCSLSVDTHDLAVMAATLADGGVNPLTGRAVVDEESCAKVLAVMATAGLYERSGDWLWDIGLPGKSGVSGAIVTVSPGKGGLATWSPRLDAAGNSVRGRLITRRLSSELGLNVFASRVSPVTRSG